jgi:hypothetical protein
LPAVLQAKLSGVQVPPVPHCWLQHSALLVQAVPSETHCLLPQIPDVQVVVQQSVGELQLWPWGTQ